jgi:hypothetical protein
MKKIYLLLFLIFSFSGYSQTVIHSYSFEDDGSGKYTTSVVEFSDGGFDFFTSTFNNTIDTNYGVTDYDGSHYFAAQDMDGEGGTVPQTLTMTFDITGSDNLGFKILIAEDDYEDPKWDGNDYFHIDYSIDGGDQTPLIWLESEGSGYNTETKVDSDFDGVGDGEVISENFMELESAISGTGSSLTVTFTFKLDSGREDIAIDNVRILEGYSADTSPSLSISSPDDNSTIYSDSVDVNLIVQNFSVGNTASDDGHIHYVLNSDDAVMKYDTNPISLTNLPEGNNTLTVSLVDSNHNPLDPAVSSTISFSVIDPLTAIPYEDSFNYSEASLSGQGKWQSLYSGDDIMVVEGNLSYNGVASTGKKISYSGSGRESFLQIDPIQNGSTYVSFWLNVNDISAVTDSDGGYFALFGSDKSTGGIDFESRIWLKPAPAPASANSTANETPQYNLSFSSASSNPDFIQTGLNVGETYLIVMSYNSASGEILGWINPSNDSATALMTSTDSTPKTISYFMLRQDSTNETASLEIDELKIGSTLDFVLDVIEFDDLEIVIYPNPVQTKLNFSGLTSPVQATVFDMLGKRQLQSKVTNSLDVSQLKSGLYMVEIKNENSAKVFNILKK